MKEILILYFSKYGATELLAREIANGVDSVEGVESKIRTVPSIPISNEKNDNIPDQGPPYIEKQDLFDCDGLILGSPCRFGNMAAELKYFLDNTTNEWLNNALAEKPAGVFTSSGSMHGGQESTLFNYGYTLASSWDVIDWNTFFRKRTINYKRRRNTLWPKPCFR